MRIKPIISSLNLFINNYSIFKSLIVLITLLIIVLMRGLKGKS